MKKLLIAVGIFLALILVVAAVLPFVIDINALVAGQIPAIEKQIHRDISIGDVKLTVLTGLGAEINNVRIANNPDFRKGDFVSIDRLKATVQLLPLFKKEMLISSVSIDKPSILIEKEKNNIFNFSDMIAPSKKPEKQARKKPGTETEGKNPLAALANIQIAEISIKDGAFKFFDASGGNAPEEISLDKLGLTLKAVSLTRKIGIDFETEVFTGSKAGHVKLSGDLGPVGTRLEPENIPVDLTLTLQGINLPNLASYIKGINIKSGSFDATTAVKGRLKESLQCRMDLDWDGLNMTMDENPKDKTSVPPQIFVNGSWRIEADVSGTVNEPVATGKILLDKSILRYGKLFDKPAGTPLTIDVSGRMEKDALQVDRLKVVLSKLALTGNAGVRNFADPFIDGQMAIAPTPLDALSPVLPQLKPYALKGSIELKNARFKGKVSELKNLNGVSGNLTIQNGSAASTELGKKIEKIQASVNVADSAIQVRNTSLKIGDSDMNFNATVRNPAKPDITFDLASSYLDVDALLPAASAEEKESGTKKEALSKGGATEKQKAPDLKAVGRISIKKCKYNKLLLENVTAELLYADAVATLKKLNIDTFGGKITTSARVDLTDMANPQWSADLATRDINANATLNKFTSLKDTLYGTFNSNLSLQGKGTDWASVSKSLAGSGSSDFLNGKLANINVLDAVGQSLLKTQGLGMVAQAISPEIKTNVKETLFQNLSGKFKLQKGQILLDAINMSAKDFKLTGTGAIGLDKTLDLNTMVVLSKSASERLQKDKTMQYLLNKDQLLEIPCTVSGDILKPNFTANGDRLKRMLKNAAKEAVSDQIQKKLGKEAGNLLKGILK